jgi:predicted phosphate transport protein (TIGR00153 family)
MAGIWNLFRKSPFGPLQEHMKRVTETAHRVTHLFDALIAGDQGKVKEHARHLSQLEGEADKVKNEVRDHLPKSVFMPVARGDLLRHIGTQDAIADCAEDLGVLLTIREMPVPDWMAPLLRDYIVRVLEAVDLAGNIVAELDVLVEAGFGGPEADRVMNMVSELNLAEHNADKVQDQIAKQLFAHEDSMKPVAVFMWSKIFNKIGDLANHAENVGDRIRLFIART